MSKDHSNEQKLAAVTTLLNVIPTLTQLSDAEREFVRHAVACRYAGKEDEGTRVALETIGAHLQGDVDRVYVQVVQAAKDVVRAARWADLKAAGKQGCSRCDATGTFINGGECWTCNGRGYRA